MDQKTFDDFFRPYAKNVDKADGVSAFWRLSDALIMEIIVENIGKRCGNETVMLDAGGGTGRWAIKMSANIRGKFVVYDRSTDMLAKAKENIEKAGLSKRISLIHGDLTYMRNIDTESIDHAVSIYSPISFIYDPESAARELFRVMKFGGAVIIMGHGYYNALASKINSHQAGCNEIEKLIRGFRVKWAPHVPDLVTYSKETMETLLLEAGFCIKKTYGVPVFVQPGPEDFDPENRQVSSVSKYLQNSDIFRKIFDLEMRYNSEETVANRGVNIFTMATKI